MPSPLSREKPTEPLHHNLRLKFCAGFATPVKGVIHYANDCVQSFFTTKASSLS